MRRRLIGLVVSASLVVAPASAQAASGDIFVSEPFAKAFSEGAVIKVVGSTQTFLTENDNLPVAQTNQIAFQPPNGVVVATGSGASVVRVDLVTGVQSIVGSGDHLSGPFGVAVGPTGQVVVTDSDNEVIGIDPNSHVQTVLASDALLAGAKGVTVAPNGDIFAVVASGVAKVVGGVATSFSTSGGVAYNNPQGITRASNGDLFVANLNGHNILRVPATGGSPVEYIDALNPVVDSPFGMATDLNGDLIVSDNQPNGNPPSGLVRINSAKQASLITQGDKLQDARGVAVDTTPVPGGGPGTPDKTITATLSAKTKQKLKKELVIDVTCPQEACTASASGSLSVPKVSASKRYKLKKVSKSLKAGEKGKLKLKLSKKVRNKAKRALRKGKKVSAKVTVSATDAAGNTTSKTLKIKLKR